MKWPRREPGLAYCSTPNRPPIARLPAPLRADWRTSGNEVPEPLG
jgi:hypothetical protein